MTEQLSSLQFLPNDLSAERLKLHVCDVSMWTYIKKLSDAERLLILTSYGNTEKDMPCLKDFSNYLQLCLLYAHAEKTDPQSFTNSPTRHYWIVNKEQERLAGYLSATLPEGTKETLALDYFILPEFRNTGLATAAVQLFSDNILKGGFAHTICAETELDNPASSQVLLKAGFREMAEGICSTADASIGVVRRFLKASTPSIDVAWPISQP